MAVHGATCIPATTPSACCPKAPASKHREVELSGRSTHRRRGCTYEKGVMIQSQRNESEVDIRLERALASFYWTDPMCVRVFVLVLLCIMLFGLLLGVFFL
jgi:hypothetical protein